MDGGRHRRMPHTYTQPPTKEENREPHDQGLPAAALPNGHDVLPHDLLVHVIRKVVTHHIIHHFLHVLVLWSRLGGGGGSGSVDTRLQSVANNLHSPKRDGRRFAPCGVEGSGGVFASSSLAI